MLEGGFSGRQYNYSAFSGEAGANCYRCFNPVTFSSMSCREYAREAARHQIVPAIPSTAAVLAGMMAEQVMNVLHDDHSAYGLRFYGDIRRAAFDRVNLAVNPDCPGEHDPAGSGRRRPARRTRTRWPTCWRSSGARPRTAGSRRPEPVVRAALCTLRGAMCQVRSGGVVVGAGSPVLRLRWPVAAVRRTPSGLAVMIPIAAPATRTWRPPGWPISASIREGMSRSSRRRGSAICWSSPEIPRARSSRRPRLKRTEIHALALRRSLLAHPRRSSRWGLRRFLF